MAKVTAGTESRHYPSTDCEMPTFRSHSQHDRSGGQVTEPVRTLGTPERRGAARRRPVVSARPTEQGPAGHRPRLVCWTGDERETTQGDW